MEYSYSGSFTLTATQSFTVVIDWTEVFEGSNNYKVVLITACQLVSYNWYGFTYYPTGTLSINGTPVVLFNFSVGSHNCTISTQGEAYPIVATGGYSDPPWSRD